MKTRTSGQGRPRGIPNKATAEARAAIATFVDGNAHKLQDWLDVVANGKPLLNKDGQPQYTDDGVQKWEVKPDPDRAFTLFQSVIEYHVPKLARNELTGDKDNPIVIDKIVREVVNAKDTNS